MMWIATMASSATGMRLARMANALPATDHAPTINGATTVATVASCSFLRRHAADAAQGLTEPPGAGPAATTVGGGGFRVSLGDTVEDLRPGSWVHMAANLPHSVLALEPGTLLLTLMRDQSE